MNEDTLTRLAYFMVQLMIKGVDVFSASEAVSSTAIEHPEWNMDEEKTWDEWEKEYHD